MGLFSVSRAVGPVVFSLVGLVAVTVTHQAWIFFVLCAGCAFFLFQKWDRPIVQNTGICLFTLFSCLTVAELVFLAMTPSEEEFSGTFTSTYFGEDQELGYGPNPGIHTAKKSFEGQVVYDQIYTISEDRLRSIPGVEPSALCSAAFFGGSVTFGEGVGDKETMPYSFVQASKGKFSALNFGFHGYGPHQMLRVLETDRLPRTSDRPINMVVYQGIEAHVDRAVGKATWDFFGPSYTMGDDGTLKYMGPFHGPIFKALNNILEPSALYVYIRNAMIRANSFSPLSVGLYMEILKRARQVIEEKYHAKFIVLFWDKGSGNALADIISQELRDHQFHVIPISTIIPDIQTNSRSYVLSPHDPHPNANTHRMIGEYLANQLMDAQC